MVKCLDSNFFVALVTLLVGSFAIFLYIKQKIDYKRDAAKLILQEIRYAEQKIRKYREVKSYRLYDRLLPKNSWNDNIHLFIKDLRETQNVDLISDFYAKITYIDTLIDTISRKKNSQAITLGQPIASAPSGAQVAVPQPGAQVAVPHHQAQAIEMPLITQALLKDVSMSVEFIYNTPVVERLRKISEKRWYQIC